MSSEKEAPINLVSVVERSGDAKLSATRNVSATWVGQQSCPESCKLKSNGCYAETGHAGLTTHRLNRRAKARRMSKAALRTLMAQQEAAGIRSLSGKRHLRVHVVGDCATPESAQIIGKAMRDHEAKQGQAAWTYSHSWRDVPSNAWQGARVLASCHTITDVREARAAGYGTAITVPKHPTNKIYEFKGERIVPCPAQFKHAGKRVVTCEHCTLCKRPEFLREQNLSVGFEPDNGSGKKILALMEVQ